jgi:hypothetical protein
MVVEVEEGYVVENGVFLLGNSLQLSMFVFS